MSYFVVAYLENEVVKQDTIYHSNGPYSGTLTGQHGNISLRMESIDKSDSWIMDSASLEYGLALMLIHISLLTTLTPVIQL